MANPLATFGLMMKGADAGRTSDRVDRAGNVDIANAQRRGVAMDQSNELGAMGLDTARQTKGTQDAVREAQIAATQQGKTWSGSLLSGAEAAAAKGDVQLATQLKQQYQALEQMGTKELIHSVMTNSTPGERPDLLKIVQQYEKTRDATGVALDENGTITVMSATAGPVKFNAGKLAEIMGMVPPPKVTSIAGDAMAVVTQPGQATQTYKNPKAEAPSNLVKEVKNEDGSSTLIDIDPKSKNYGKPIMADGRGGAGGVNVRKDLAVSKEISDSIPMLGPEYAQYDPINGKVTYTEKGEKTALIAEWLRMNPDNKDMGVRSLLELATKGEAKWKNENGKKIGVVLYRGQEFVMKTPQGAPISKPAPTKPAVTAPKPAPAAPARAPTPRPAAVQAQPEKAAPGLETTKPTEPQPRNLKEAKAQQVARERVVRINQIEKAIKSMEKRLKAPETLQAGGTDLSKSLRATLDKVKKELKALKAQQRGAE